MPIRPLHNRILIRRPPAETVTRGGIILPDIAQERPIRATVVAVGPRRSAKGDPLPALVAVGDEILCSKYAGIECREPESGELLALIDEAEVMGHFEPAVIAERPKLAETELDEMVDELVDDLRDLQARS